MNSLNLTLIMTLNNTIVQRNATIEFWDKDVSFKLSFYFIPAPRMMDWGQSFAVFSWDAKNSVDKSLSMNRTISVVPKQENVVGEALQQNIQADHTHEPESEDHVHPYGQKSSTPILLRPQTHVGDVLDKWEGSILGEDTKEKGSGPVLYVKIKFNQQVSPGFNIKYTIKSITHTNWQSEYTMYWIDCFA